MTNILQLYSNRMLSNNRMNQNSMQMQHKDARLKSMEDQETHPETEQHTHTNTYASTLYT